ncbi:rod shape-determining protein MreC [Candidatus Azambacteria bacterium]|nr:rod shape-determining protein MreC [Candidatus Azambacteria bacterium]
MAGPHKKKKWIMLAVAMILLLIFFARAGTTAPFENIMVRATAPLAASALYAWHTVAGFGMTAADMKNAGAEVAALREENQRLQAEVVRQAELARENEALRAQLGVDAARSRTLVDAEVIAFDPLSFTNYAVINRGSRDGVKEQMPVIMPGDVVFGKITNVHETTSEVMLITDSDNKVSGTTISQNASGVLGGAKGGTLVLDLIEKSAAIALGELVVTSGLDGVYPRGLIIGRVLKIISEEEGIFQQAQLKAAYAETLPSTVFVITGQRQ